MGYPYILIGQPDKNIPVYNVQRESDRMAQGKGGEPKQMATVSSAMVLLQISESDTKTIIVPERRRSRPISNTYDSSGRNGNVSEYRNISIPLNSHGTSSFIISDRNVDYTHTLSQYSGPTESLEPSDGVLSATEAAPRRSGIARNHQIDMVI